MTEYRREIISYCMNEFSVKFNIRQDVSIPKFTFHQLSEQNITGRQLYLWSAPIDLIEDYQFYLDQRSTTNDLSLSENLFYNCTMPRFGPMCQYQLPYHYQDHSSLDEIIKNFYANYEYAFMTSFTCYIHLQCHRGPSPLCLQWMEICDGKIDCLDGGQDEEHCWQLEINECKTDEYRCHNGQCIPQSFHRDLGAVADCADISDEPSTTLKLMVFCRHNDQPSFSCEDQLAQYTNQLNSYLKKHTELLTKTIYSSRNNFLSEECWSALKSLLDLTYSSDESDHYIDMIQDNCSETFYFPNVPVLFNNIYFLYRKDDFQNRTTISAVPFYICYDQSQYKNFFLNYTKIIFENITCIHAEPFLPLFDPSSYPLYALHQYSIDQLHASLRRYHLPLNYTLKICNRSSMYQCLHSVKCISVYRLIDGINDCPYMDDENIIVLNESSNLVKQLEKILFKCQISDKYIPQSFVGNDICDCLDDPTDWCEDEDEYIKYLKTNIVFQHICDGFVDRFPLLIDNRNETDETECEQWECNNVYTRCNHLWNCLDGADEAGCVSYSTLNCSSKEHFCVLFNTNQLTCLSVDKANDGYIDCLGATDEPGLCGTRKQVKSFIRQGRTDFYCMNFTSQLCLRSTEMCNGFEDCENGEDEQFCANRTVEQGYCTLIPDDYSLSDVERFLCEYRLPIRHWNVIYFILDGMRELIENEAKSIEKSISSSTSSVRITPGNEPRCHRGLDLRVWLNNEDNSTSKTCLCPSSFYGDQCQYQNQRISLTIKFQAPAGSSQTVFAIIISLIDNSDQRIIHSFEQLTFLSVRDCQVKFNVYLLYSIRSKDPSKTYFIHIDIYEKASFVYRGSLLFPVLFPFLPVYRLSSIVDIPRNSDATRNCLTNRCKHGQCIKYSNRLQDDSFCRCDEGWSGQHCHIRYVCRCSSDSLCIGLSANNNRSICICPIDKFGPRCLLFDPSCQVNDNSPCENGGQCIPNDDYLVSNRKFTCICRRGFSGDRCQTVDNNITISFSKDIVPSQSILIHFIEVIDIRNKPVRSTTFKTIPVKQDSVIIYWARPFHLVFIELFNHTYYLVIVQKISNRSTAIDKTINPSDRCPHISEVLNNSMMQWELLRRIKSYHLPCQTSDLQCFYDEIHLCLCYHFGGKRLANCLQFEHNMTSDCWGQSECENGGQCFQDKPDCPSRSICVCPPCFYGTRCQFNTRGFGLSLNAILGYHIFPYLRFIDQPFIVQMSLTLTIIFFVVGLINGILSLMTFKNSSAHEVGCGLYLLGSSITTLLITMMFGLNFLILILTQMTIISNRSFLLFQCYSLDYLLRICLCMDQWLIASVAMERTITIIQGTRFVKKKSQQIARFVMIILLIIITCTFVHDPIHRRLIDEDIDDDQSKKRIWCIVRYSSRVEVYDYYIHILHFVGPFLTNIISASTLVIKQSHLKAIMDVRRSYREHFWEQCREHKHILIAPIVLAILAFPRLIISFVSKCMQSANDSWIFLIGYFISFIPSMLTFILFIAPSKFYMKEFHKSIQQFRRIIQ